MKLKTVKSSLKFLNRVDLTASEVNEFIEVREALEQIKMKAEEEEEDRNKKPQNFLGGNPIK